MKISKMNTHKLSVMYYFIMILACLPFVNADELVLTDTLKIGHSIDPSETSKTYEIGDVTLNIQLIVCDQNKEKCAININGESSQYAQSDVFNFGDSYYLVIDLIVYGFCDNRRFCNRYYDAYDIVTVSFYSKLEKDDNPEGVCGDNMCSSEEVCDADSCCWGKTKDLQRDASYCRSCRNTCGAKELCTAGICAPVSKCGDDVCQEEENCVICSSDCKCLISERCEEGLCVKYCGNNICEKIEGCNSCKSDCKCRSGFECLNDQCSNFHQDECLLDSDCDDSLFCTVDSCAGIPKKCGHLEREGCESNASCVLSGTADGDLFCDGAAWVAKKKQSEECTYNYECQNNVCSGNICSKQSNSAVIVAESEKKTDDRPEEKNIIRRVINWLFGLFW